MKKKRRRELTFDTIKIKSIITNIFKNLRKSVNDV